MPIKIVILGTVGLVAVLYDLASGRHDPPAAIALVFLCFLILVVSFLRSAGLGLPRRHATYVPDTANLFPPQPAPPHSSPAETVPSRVPSSDIRPTASHSWSLAGLGGLDLQLAGHDAQQILTIAMAYRSGKETEIASVFALTPILTNLEVSKPFETSQRLLSCLTNEVLYGVMSERDRMG